MIDKVTSIRFAGIGGMGVLKASLLFAELLFRQGYDVKKAEIHGMSQRGGSISSDVRFGSKVFSPMIPSSTMDYLVLLQADQLPLYETELSPETIIFKPDMIDVNQLKNKRSLNVAMLGLLSKELDIPVSKWKELICEIFPIKTHPVNIDAFDLGRKSA